MTVRKPITLVSGALQLLASTDTMLLPSAVTAVSGGIIDMSLGDFFTFTAVAATTWSVTNAPASGYVRRIILELTNGGNYTQTWMSGMQWTGFAAPTFTTSGGVDIIEIYTIDGGTTWRGILQAANVGVLGYATLDPANKGTGVTLSNSNKTFTLSSGASGLARSTKSKSAGSWYWEVTLGTFQVGDSVGIVNASANLNYTPGEDTNGVSFGSNGSTGSYFGYGNSQIFTYGSNFATGSVLGFALNATAGTLAIYLNNTLLATVTYTTYISNPVYPAVGATVDTAAMTVNFGASAFVYTPPSGFNAGIY